MTENYVPFFFFFLGCCVGGLKSKLIAMFEVQFFPQYDRVMSFLFYFINTKCSYKSDEMMSCE